MRGRKAVVVERGPRRFVWIDFWKSWRSNWRFFSLRIVSVYSLVCVGGEREGSVKKEENNSRFSNRTEITLLTHIRGIINQNVQTPACDLRHVFGCFLERRGVCYIGFEEVDVGFLLVILDETCEGCFFVADEAEDCV